MVCVCVCVWCVCVYSPSVSLVICELLNIMDVCLPVVVGLIVCSGFSMKSLHIDPCLCLFSQLLHNVTVFDCDVSLTSASLSLCLV